MRRKCALLFIVIAAAAALPGALYAAETPLAREIMSPYCPGLALSDCPSPPAAELRAWIREQEAAGIPRETVRAQLFAQYGDKLLQRPRAQGIGLLAYAIPVGAIIIGALVLGVYFLRRANKESTVQPEPELQAQPQSDELARAVDAEIAGEGR